MYIIEFANTVDQDDVVKNERSHLDLPSLSSSLEFSVSYSLDETFFVTLVICCFDTLGINQPI